MEALFEVFVLLMLFCLGSVIACFRLYNKKSPLQESFNKACRDTNIY